MPSVVATLRIKPDKIEEAKAFLCTLATNVRANEPGTTAYLFHQRKDDPCVFVAYEKYTSDEAFKTHGTNLRAHGATFAGLLDGRPEILMLEEI